jgi:hypothetical protein
MEAMENIVVKSELIMVQLSNATNVYHHMA